MPPPEVRDGGSRDLERSEERFRLLVDSVLDYAIFLLDTEGRVQSWNSGAERLKGYEAAEIVGRPFAEFYPEEDRRAGLPDQLLGQARRDGRVRHSGWRIRKDGSRFWADVAITALYEDGELTGFAKVTRDMTEMHRAQEERAEALAEQRRAVERLEQLDRWRRDFVRSIVHDLQSPVTSILGFARFLQEDPLSEDERHRLVERIGSNASTLQDLIDHLRTWALLESGNVELELEPIELCGFLRDLVDDLAPALTDRRVRVAGDAVTVPADRQGIERVARNLLINAARHTMPGGSILVEVRQEPDLVTVTVEDDGEGLQEELLTRVFDRFERGRNGGTGLGLAIVKEYIELHGGQVWAESPEGQGAIFSFTLPRSRARMS